ncbi:hypothetical protein HYFRA_00002092 [Hymenoscyphus fraxineus]|uniref:F-box domain-containing protein n=1 Tax=Hymenoscyphus fraxineus TaxID=746836 RepID=A0A9N9PEC6_9HELO|nr:hypothetical protein HYFRA_00002092 [Hymenoscyphus fraxineus]
MFDISKCNDEILLLIIEQLPSPKDLASLAICSRRLYNATKPWLYSSCILRKPTSIHYYLRTILAHGDLGDRAKRLVYSTEESYSNPENLEDADWQRLQLVMVKGLPYSANFDHRLHWKRLRKGVDDAFLSMLLCVLPNLEEIDMLHYGSSERGHPYVESFLKRAATYQRDSSSSPLAMKSLRRVRLHNMDENSFPDKGLALFQALPYLELESVQYFSCHRVNGPLFPRPNFGIDRHIDTPGSIYCDGSKPKSLFSKDTVSLTHAFIQPEQLRKFFQLFSSIRRLEFDFNHEDESIDNWEQHKMDFVPQSLVDSVAHLSHSLEELILTQHECPNVVIDDKAERPISPLLSFQKLIKLKISAHLLLGKDRRSNSRSTNYNQMAIFDQHFFPKSLKHLTICDCNTSIFRVLKSWALPGNLLPENLETLNISFTSDSWQMMEDVTCLSNLTLFDSKFLPWNIKINLASSVSPDADWCPGCVEVEGAREALELKWN